MDGDIPRTVGQLVNWLKTVYEASISKCAKCVTSFDKVSNIASDLKQNRFVHIRLFGFPRPVKISIKEPICFWRVDTSALSSSNNHQSDLIKVSTFAPIFFFQLIISDGTFGDFDMSCSVQLAKTNVNNAIV